MGLRFTWRRWVPDQRHDTEDELGGVIDLGLQTFDELDDSEMRRKFLELWDYWNKQFPERWVLTTLTAQSCRNFGYQLRFWFGEPKKFRPDHVDSSGHNLIASVYGCSIKHLVAFAESLQGSFFQRLRCLTGILTSVIFYLTIKIRRY